MGTSQAAHTKFWIRLLGTLGALLGLMLAFSAPLTFASPPDAPGAPNATGVVVKNYWGHDMSFTISDTAYMIPADGQLFIALTPGDYTFSANAVGADESDRDGEIVIASGERLDLAFAAGLPVEISVEAQPQIPVTGQAQPSASATAQPQTNQPASNQPSKTGVLVKNYWGDVLNFTIADTQYTIPSNGQLFIVLAPGDYTFSSNVSSDDRSDQNGEVVLTTGQTVTIASYLNSPLFQ